jgi:hypothetical protein
MMLESDTEQMNSSNRISRSNSEPPKNTNDYVFNRGGIDFDDSENQRVYM